ncbi:MAG: glycerophosphodiester phosphodiesterase [Thermoleophilia bacterium]
MLERLARHGLLERALVCSTEPPSLRELRRLAPGVRTGLVPRRPTGCRAGWLRPPSVRHGRHRAALPYRIAGLVEGAQASAAMLYHRVVTPAVVRRCRARGIAVYAWTVDDPGELARVVAAGVDGVISNDPRIFAALP